MILLIEPFYGGSHAQLIHFIVEILSKSSINFDLVTMPAKKWHWRARTSALYLSQLIQCDKKYSIVFCSSVLNLAELMALRKDLANCIKIIYFHENQFVYPVQNDQERDFQYGYNTILSALVADMVVFNSKYNMNTFLDNISKHLKKQPDFFVPGIKDLILPKCQVLYFPVNLNEPRDRCGIATEFYMKTRALKVQETDEFNLKQDKIENVITSPVFDDKEIVHIIWPHRWEHDKNPELFFNTLFKLKDEGLSFKVSVIGEPFKDQIPIFETAKNKLKENIINFGRLESKSSYFECLKSGDVVVSTARHEFFGVAMLEAVLNGCFPIAPNNLVYPELYPRQCLYNTPQQLYKKLKMFCLKPFLAQKYHLGMEFDCRQFCKEVLSQHYLNLFKIR